MNGKSANDHPQVKVLEESDFPDAVKVLTSAFRNDPLMTHMFPDQKRDAEIAVFFEFMLTKSKLLHESLYGLSLNGEILGVSCVESPFSPKPSATEILAFISQSLRFMFRIPLRSFIFINKYMKSTTSARPKNKHHYLIFIGIDPRQQGRGLGKFMLDHIHSQVKSEPVSTGIGLDTENQVNVAMYEHLGYNLYDTHTIVSLPIYCMFKSI
jgi:ribosomal protein S18 acetylase RimI-like enzyme